MIRGTVLTLNRRRGMAVVEVDSGSCSVLGGLNGDASPQFNDIVTGRLNQPGAQFLYNETRSTWFRAFLHACDRDAKDAMREIGMN